MDLHAIGVRNDLTWRENRTCLLYSAINSFYSLRLRPWGVQFQLQVNMYIFKLIIAIGIEVISQVHVFSIKIPMNNQTKSVP